MCRGQDISLYPGPMPAVTSGSSGGLVMTVTGHSAISTICSVINLKVLHKPNRVKTPAYLAGVFRFAQVRTDRFNAAYPQNNTIKPCFIIRTDDDTEYSPVHARGIINQFIRMTTPRRPAPEVATATPPVAINRCYRIKPPLVRAG